MAIRRTASGELRAYIKVGGTWRHVYILGGYDQTALVGDPVRMLEFKLSKSTRLSHIAPKSSFRLDKPSKPRQKQSA